MLSLDLSALCKGKTNTEVHFWCYRAKIQHLSCVLIFWGLREGHCSTMLPTKVRSQSMCY